MVYPSRRKPPPSAAALSEPPLITTSAFYQVMIVSLTELIQSVVSVGALEAELASRPFVAAVAAAGCA